MIANGKWELDATTTEFKHGNYELLVRLGDGNGVVPDNPVEVKQAFTVDTSPTHNPDNIPGPNTNPDAGDEAFDQFVLWQDVNQDGVSDAGELLSLTAANIATLDLLSDGQQSSPAAGVMQFGQAAYSRTDGTDGVLLDVSLSYSEEPPLNNDNGSALSPDII